METKVNYEGGNPMDALKEIQAQIDAQGKESVVAETPAETKVETPIANETKVETPIEGKVETSEETQKDWKEILSEQKAEAEAKAKEDALRAKLEKLEEDNLYKFIDNLREEGKSEKEIKKAVKALIDSDPEDYTERELFDMTLAGELNEDGEPLTEYEKEAQFEMFKTMPKSVQERTLSAQKAELENRFNEASKIFAPNNSGLEAKVAESSKVAYDGLMSSLDELVGKEILGVNITNKIAVELHKEAVKQLKSSFNGTDYDVQTALDNALAIKLLPHIVKDEVKKAESNVTKRLFKEFHSPSATGKPIVSNSTTSKTDLEKTAEQMEEFAKRNSDPFGVKNK